MCDYVMYMDLTLIQVTNKISCSATRIFYIYVSDCFSFKLSARALFIVQTVAIVTALVAVIVGLTVGLRTPAPPNGGSPTLPPPTTAPPVVPKYQSAYKEFRFAAVATDASLCSGIGTYVLLYNFHIHNCKFSKYSKHIRLHLL